jgi:hypothetical protein
MRIPLIRELWFTRDVLEWDTALKRYWELIRCENILLEQDMERLDRERIRRMSPDEWFVFLRDKYFRWKYTAPNRYATTTSVLNRKGETDAGRQELYRLKSQILEINPGNIHDSIALITKGRLGLGTAGASGLLALLYPETFGTVDQFVVKALREIPNLPESAAITRMKPEGLTPRDGEILIQILRRHAGVLTNALGKTWRPRDVDKVLWTYGRKKQHNTGSDCTPSKFRKFTIAGSPQNS